MASLRETDQKTAKKKGLLAAGATGASVLVMATLSVPLGIVALVPAAYLGWDWFAYRAKRGMRF